LLPRISRSIKLEGLLVESVEFVTSLRFCGEGADGHRTHRQAQPRVANSDTSSFSPKKHDENAAILLAVRNNRKMLKVRSRRLQTFCLTAYYGR
jgi:hypothetical protein